MGAVLMTLLSFIVGLLICGVWSSLTSLGIAPLPASGNLNGIFGLTVSVGALVGLVLQVVWS